MESVVDPPFRAGDGDDGTAFLFFAGSLSAAVAPVASGRFPSRTSAGPALSAQRLPTPAEAPVSDAFQPPIAPRGPRRPT
jgi:hypothetical protein